MHWSIDSSYHLHPPPSCALVAGSMALNNLSVKYTKSRLRSSMLIWENPSYVDIYVFKVCRTSDWETARLFPYWRYVAEIGLTEDHPTLTTYFEGEIIGSKYSFLTQHQDWGSTDKVDLQHWAKFSAFRPFQKQARKGNLHIPNLAQRENIFMRWKEHFLVPDHRVRTISGASFEGFYYICFNQIQGTVSGIYFHAKSEKYVTIYRPK